MGQKLGSNNTTKHKKIINFSGIYFLKKLLFKIKLLFNKQIVTSNLLDLSYLQLATLLINSDLNYLQLATLPVNPSLGNLMIKFK
jgi:hypothetical protein